MATTEMNCLASGGGKLSLVFNPQKTSNNAGFLAFETANISHFKGTWNSSSTYADDTSKFVVGYANSLNISSMSLTDAVGIGGADFNVSKSYTYLVCLCNDSSYWGRMYDIEITL